MAALMETLFRAVYPPRCISCGGLTDRDFALCGPCWRDTPFVGPVACDQCGAPLPGEPGEEPTEDLRCDDCLALPRPWSRGRTLWEYRGTARRMVLALKHGDRTDLARSMGPWLAQAARPIVVPNTVIVPVPLHWRRLLTRRYNQSVLLARAMGRELNLPVLPDALVRTRATPALGGLGREARFVTLAETIRPHPRRGAAVAGRPVLLIDDVMTSGATFAAATEALADAGAGPISVLSLARAVKDT